MYSLQETQTWSPLDIVVTIAEPVCSHILERVLGLSAYGLQIFPVKHEYLRSFQLCEDEGIREKLKKLVRKRVHAILTNYMEIRL